MDKSKRKPFAKLDKVNFTPNVAALINADKEGWKSVETVIVDGLCKNIMDERVAIVESATLAITKFDEEIKKMEPKDEATYGVEDRQKIIKQASFTDTQLKVLEKKENKRNKIVKALNLVMTEFNDKNFKELKKIVNDNKLS